MSRCGNTDKLTKTKGITGPRYTSATRHRLVACTDRDQVTVVAALVQIKTRRLWSAGLAGGAYRDQATLGTALVACRDGDQETLGPRLTVQELMRRVHWLASGVQEQMLKTH